MMDILKNAISKHIIEIRFRPDGHFLDRRGQIAESLIGSSTPFKHWNITANRIDFSSKDNVHVKAFLSYRNLGLVSTSPNETAFFVESAEGFIKSAWSNLPNREFSRIGIRSMFLVETDDFSRTLEGYRKRFLKLSDEEIREFGGDLIDLGFLLNFKYGENRFNVMTGQWRGISPSSSSEKWICRRWGSSWILIISERIFLHRQVKKTCCNC